MARAILLAQAEEERQKYLFNIARRQLRDQSDPMNLPEEEFVMNFRLTKERFTSFYLELEPLLGSCRRRTGVHNRIKLLSALSFFAHGSYQRNAGASAHLSMSQPTFSKCLHHIVTAINSEEILKKYIKFPNSQIEREEKMRSFMERFGFPGIVGCIDGTHVAIIRPTDHEEAYCNRKSYHSLNVMAICDADLNFIHIDSSHGGAAHDSFVWNNSIIKRHMEHLHSLGEGCWLLGDSGYAQRPWMMTPIISTAPGSPEEHYTNLHCTTRNTVERCFGVLKARWRCLLAHRVLHYAPTKAAKIVNSCVVLHNIANAANIASPQMPTDDLTNDQQRQININAVVSANEVDGNDCRQRLVHRLFEGQ